MQNILSKAKKEDIVREPFPFIVIKDALDSDLYSQLDKEFPDIDVLANGKKYKSNQRLNYQSHRALNNPNISNLWKDFIKVHLNQKFWHDIVDLFGEDIAKITPNLGSLNSLKDKKVDIRKKSHREKLASGETDLLFTVNISANTPVIKKSSIQRTAHVDKSTALFFGLLYFRDPNDNSTGGDLEIYKYKDGHTPLGSKEELILIEDKYIEDKHIEKVNTIKYDSNVLVFALNSLNSVHGVSERGVTKFPRKFVYFAGIIEKPLFDTKLYKENIIHKYKRKLFRFFFKKKTISALDY